MFDFKLQIGCLLVIIYYILLYLRDTTGKNRLKCHAGINDLEFLKIAYEVARYHHEKWNGKGYPEGLAGGEIFIKNPS